MNFIQRWPKAVVDIVRKRLPKIRQEATDAAGNMLYGFLGTMALWPVFTAMQGGDLIGPISALAQVAGQVGGNLIAGELSNWCRGKSEAEAAGRLAELARENADVRKALDAILDHLEAPKQVAALLSPDDRHWFLETLRKEVKALGSTVNIEIHGDVSVLVSEGARTGDIAGHNIINITIENLIAEAGEASQRKSEVQSLFHDYLRGVWGTLINLPMLAVRETSGRKEVPLTAVYTALDVTETIGPEADSSPREKRGPEDARRQPTTLKGDEDYIRALVKRVRKEMAEAEQDAEGDRRRVTALEASAASRRRVLLGQAGSGKSTFARFLALCLIGEALGKREANLGRLNDLNEGKGVPASELLPWPHGALLPIFVELRRFVRSEHFTKEGDTARAQHLLDYVERDSRFSAEFVTYFRKYLGNKDGGAILILDGLDETPEAEKCRDRLRDVIVSFASTYPSCRILVTSRPYAYTLDSPWRLDDAGFVESTLAPFNDDQIGTFVHHWYSFMASKGQIDPDTVNDRVEDLRARIRQESYLRPLAERPLMLTMMTDLHASGGGSLPGNRAELYEGSVRLLLDRWNQVREVPGVRTVAEDIGMSIDDMREAMEELAYKVHGEKGSGGDEAAEIAAGEVFEALMKERPKDRKVDEGRVIEYLHQRAGILMAESERLYRFPHRTYQEYLAACHLIRTNFPDLLRTVAGENPQLWREAVLFAAGKVAKVPHTVWALLEKLISAKPPKRVERDDVRLWLALYAGLAVRENRLTRGIQEQDEIKLERIRLWLRRTLEDGALPPPDRAEAGRVLALLGDDRPGVGLTGDGIPDIDWVKIPAGAFVMGSREGDEDAFDDETPQHEVKLPAYQISRHPVTNAQFRAFVEDGGYTEEHRDCWTAAGLEWRGDRQGPDDDLDADFLLANHPRVNVTWYEAVAFSRWLGKKLGREVRLPTEGEWERAARGGDGRRYPWGNEFDSAKCNMAETGVGRTSAVGMFPEGASPYGVDDMGGNVWEWCGTRWRESYEDPVDEGPEGEAARVVRGGAFYDDRRYVRCAYRSGLSPDLIWLDIGFRVAAPV